MIDQLKTLITGLKAKTITFNEVISFIESQYNHQPTAFKNGEVDNEATQNQGSAKVFAFAQRQQLSEADTLYLFAEHYQAVLANPDAADHQNIRQFMVHGWAGIQFHSEAQ
ncbi:HopJ type III effector protein [Pedobacter immunditicola]|uniref:HopJ type III effector protein n=1 Tax=Pedobacter immunditicola TaxID=3133440 RepID=UPI0030A85C98